MLKIAVLISGTGRSLAHLLDLSSAGKLSAEVVLVVSSRANAGGLVYAERGQIASQTIAPRDFADVTAFSDAVFAACREAGVELVVLAGYLKRLLIPRDFESRVVNIHPSLIPAFSGHGFYGHHVHQAVLDYGVKVTGCTVHFVDNEYDHGAVILQRVVAVHDDDTADVLAARVFEQEKIAYPEAIELIAQNRIKIVGRRVVVQQ
ncbi:MAG: phosphoribosylglycinamide formyltransferase [Thermoguttaceae bacterium]